MRLPILAAFIGLAIPALAFADLLPSETPAAPATSGSASEASLMAEGTRAYNIGDMNAAAQYFIQVAQSDPHNTTALQYLRKVRAALILAGAKPNNLDSLVIPKITLNQATFSTALDFFKDQAAKQNVTVSFVPQLPAAQLQTPVTLNLSQIPFLDALHYLCQLNKATYKVDPYAIVITPDTGAAAQ